MADANMRWSVDEAIRAARALRDLELVWLEEPTIPDDVPGHARIVREGGVPIAAGENLRTLYEFRALIAAGGVTFPEPDVTNCGGVTVVHEGLPPGRGLQPAGDLARRARHHRASARRRRRTAPTSRRTASGSTATSPSRCGSRTGCAIAPDRPGHGVAFDWKGLEKLPRMTAAASRAGVGAGGLFTTTRCFVSVRGGVPNAGLEPFLACS